MARGPVPTSLRARIDAAQRSLGSLRADFRETIAHPLLAEPVVQEGQLWLRLPDALRWEVELPAPARYTLWDGVYVGYFADEGRAERRDVRRWQRRLARQLAIGRPLEELERSYRIDLSSSAVEGGGEQRVSLVLTPRSRRARKRISQLELTFAGEPLMPEQLTVVGTAGESRRIEFLAIEAAVELPDALFAIEVPEGVPVEDGFSWLDGVLGE